MAVYPQLLLMFIFLFIAAFPRLSRAERAAITFS